MAIRARSGLQHLDRSEGLACKSRSLSAERICKCSALVATAATMQCQAALVALA